MPKAVRMCISQQMPNYRKPASFLIKETYPLPPYSSVIGMIFTACGFKGYDNYPMDISVQGDNASVVSDLATVYNFGIKYDESRHWGKVEKPDGGYDGVNRGVSHYELLTDVSLVIHVVPHDESLLQTIYDGLYNPPMYLSLGRYEDLIRMDDLRITELEPAEDAMFAKHDMYVPEKYLDVEENTNTFGTIYKIGKVFSVDEKTKLRSWKKMVTVRHVCKDQLIESESMLKDQSSGEPVFLA